MSAISRLEWMLRAYKLKKNILGFSASPLSLASKDVTFAEYVRLHGNTVIFNASIGRYTYLVDSRAGNITIGSFCSIGSGSRLGGMGAHPIDMLSTHPVFYSTLKQCGASFVDQNHFDEFKRTTIGHDVWVGVNAVVLDGVSIGNGSVIAAGAVVTKDVPDYAIVAGAPARIVKFRFPETEVQSLQKLQWWTLPTEVLRAHADIFRSGNISGLIDALTVRRSPQ
ncbi:CatB-related O-acetyltransferase [Methylibium sp.]|uniref:CatB-related O-acetyltransferase n=1 Tax=Methylibium sp. TaxID=2067992 RepID=UPI003D0D20E7